MTVATSRRILIVDDQASIHDDYRKIIAPARTEYSDLVAAEAELFGNGPSPLEQDKPARQVHDRLLPLCASVPL